MTLAQSDKLWLQTAIENAMLKARNAAYEAAEEVVKQHVKACPHGQAFGRFKAWVVGIGVGFFLAGGVGGYGLAMLLSKAGGS